MTRACFQGSLALQNGFIWLRLRHFFIKNAHISSARIPLFHKKLPHLAPKILIFQRPATLKTRPSTSTDMFFRMMAQSFFLVSRRDDEQQRQ